MPKPGASSRRPPSTLRIFTDLVADITVDGRGRVVLKPKKKGGGQALADLLKASLKPAPPRKTTTLMEARMVESLLATKDAARND